MRTLRRFESLGLLDVLNRFDAAMAFDLADDFRDVWARLTATPASGEEQRPASNASAHDVIRQEGEARERGIFLSVAESQKSSLARPFRALLANDGLEGFIVSDEPLPDGTFTPEEKVDAYLERSDAVIVFATADLEAEQDRYTRPNIADEIARARSKAHLRNRVCVLREQGVILPSNIDPAYEQLDPAEPGEAYRRALRQLRSWGYDATVPPEASLQIPAVIEPSAEVNEAAPIARDEQSELLEHAQGLVPDRQHAASEVSLAVILAAGPRQTVLRPAQLEAADLARRLTQQLLFGDPALFDSSEGTDARMSGMTLVVRQSRAWLALDSEATIVVVRPIRRGNRDIGLPAVIEEDITSDISEVIRFDAQLLEQLDPEQGLSTFVPLAALVGASYGAWRTRAELAASPNSMAMNIGASERVVGHLTPPGVERASLSGRAEEIAEDLMVLLRRAATTRQ
jgi:hypothetical protein